MSRGTKVYSLQRELDLLTVWVFLPYDGPTVYVLPYPRDWILLGLTSVGAQALSFSYIFFLLDFTITFSGLILGKPRLEMAIYS